MSSPAIHQIGESMKLGSGISCTINKYQHIEKAIKDVFFSRIYL